MQFIWTRPGDEGGGGGWEFGGVGRRTRRQSQTQSQTAEKKGETKAKLGAGRRKTTRTHVLPVHLRDLLV